MDISEDSPFNKDHKAHIISLKPLIATLQAVFVKALLILLIRKNSFLLLTCSLNL